MSQNKEQILIDHLDGVLKGEELREAETLIQTDQEMAQEWQYLHFAVAAIREAGLQERVAGVRKQYQASMAKQSKSQGAVVRHLYRNVLRVAACVLILIGAATVYKYISVSSVSVYNKYYTSFELNTSRGVEHTDAMDRAYQNKNWAEVISLFSRSQQKTNKSYFLTGMANLELKNHEQAIDDFNEIIAANARTHDDYFQDQAEYYLAMSYLANNEATKALPILEKIKADKNHLYHEKATEISSLDIKILSYKNHK
jgi:Tetratricopeptide repeat